MKRCPQCGQAIVPEIRLNGPVLQRIYNELRKAPRTPDELRDLIWGARAIHPHAIYVEIRQLKHKLRPHGLTVRCYRDHRYSSTYYLEATE